MELCREFIERKCGEGVSEEVILNLHGEPNAYLT